MLPLAAGRRAGRRGVESRAAEGRSDEDPVKCRT